MPIFGGNRKMEAGGFTCEDEQLCFCVYNIDEGPVLKDLVEVTIGDVQTIILRFKRDVTVEALTKSVELKPIEQPYADAIENEENYGEN